MAAKYEAPRGMEDILPGEIEKWQWLEEKARVFFGTMGFREIRTPIVESTDLFARSIGETTDIVHKEMYTFEDRGGRSLTLRPEMTASVARAVVQNGLLKTAPNLFLFYMGPMFRAERPQAGRKRQFHQIGAEIVNLNGVEADFAIIKELYDFLESLKIQNIRLKINDLSLINGKKAQDVRGKLKTYFEGHKDKLDKDSLYRLDKNVLRIFDSKVPATQAIAENAPWDEIAPFGNDFKTLQQNLKDRGIPFVVERKLVRGLDYYTGIVFEISLDGLGAQDAVAGGGRYNNLYAELGGGDVPCTGFSIGMERLLMALEKSEQTAEKQSCHNFVCFVPVAKTDGSEAWAKCREASRSLSESGFRVLLNSASIKVGDQLKKANKLRARFVVIKGEDEIKSKVWTVKYMDKNKEEKVAEGELLQTLMKAVKELKLP